MRKFWIGLFALIVIISLIAGVYWYKTKMPPIVRYEQIQSLTRQLEDSGKLQNGDIIFQTSLSPQSKAIQLATHSAYSHCGIVWWNAGYCSVWEAHDAVGGIDVDKWIARGQGGHFVVKRLKWDIGMNGMEMEDKMQKALYAFLNRPYDIYFGWGDDKLYCSEFVWKVYERATGLQLGKLQRLGDFDLSNPIVAAKLKERYGKQLPLQEKVISPAAIFNSELLETVVTK